MSRVFQKNTLLSCGNAFTSSIQLLKNQHNLLWFLWSAKLKRLSRVRFAIEQYYGGSTNKAQMVAYKGWSILLFQIVKPYSVLNMYHCVMCSMI